jgi:hypothetical protein
MAFQRTAVSNAVVAALVSSSVLAIHAEDRVIVEPTDIESAPAAVRANFERVKALRQSYAKDKIGALKISRDAVSLMSKATDPGRPNDLVLVWKLFPEVAFRSVRAHPVRQKEAKPLTWVGVIAEKKFESLESMPTAGIVATVDRNHVYARIVDKRRVFQLVPLGSQYQAVVELDLTKVPNVNDQLDIADGMDDGSPQPDIPDDTPPKILPGEMVDVTTGCASGVQKREVLDIGIVYTKEATDKLPALDASGNATAGPPTASDVAAFSNHIIALTQETFDSSRVLITANLAGQVVFEGMETANTDAVALLESVRSSDTFVPLPGAIPSLALSPAQISIPEWRNRARADVAMVITTRENYPGINEPIGGISPSKKDVLKRDNAYSLVVQRFADIELSFQHELGHQFGAGHDPVWQLYPKFSYGMGFRNNCEWRTIMAYGDKNTCALGVPRVSLFSTCAFKMNGVIPGGPKQNNVRLLNNKAHHVSKYFRP